MTEEVAAEFGIFYRICQDKMHTIVCGNFSISALYKGSLGYVQPSNYSPLTVFTVSVIKYIFCSPNSRTPKKREFKVIPEIV
jgi:hypothetical protein